MDDPTRTSKADHAAYVARESKQRVAVAWLELIEAAKTEPKARAFLEAFSSEAVKAVAGAGGGVGTDGNVSRDGSPAG